MSTKTGFKSCTPNQMVPFPRRAGEDIAGNDPMRFVDAIVGNPNFDNFRKSYRGRGCSPHNPRVPPKGVIYAHMDDACPCRGTGKRPPRGIRSTWLADHDEPGFVTISRSRNRVRDETDNILTRSVLMPAGKGFVSPDVENAGGTKMESKADGYAFVWRKAAERNRAKPAGKTAAPPSRTDGTIAWDDASGNERVEFTPGLPTGIIEESGQPPGQPSGPKDKGRKRRCRGREKRTRDLGRDVTS